MAARIHVVSAEEGRWGVKEEGRDDMVSTHDTRPEAIRAARSQINGTDGTVMVHDEEGNFLSSDEVEKELESTTPAPMSSAVDSDVYTHDVKSVGTRVSWSALFSGLLIAIAINIPMTAFGVALGLTVANTTELSAEGFSIAAVTWVAVTVLVSLFLGGFVAARNTTWESPTEALQYGVLLWALFVVGVPAVASAGINVAPYKAIDSKWNATSNQESPKPTDISKATGISKKASEKIVVTSKQIDENISSTSPTTAAWISLGIFFVSLVTSCLGAYCGSGPDLDRRLLRSANKNF